MAASMVLHRLSLCAKSLLQTKVLRDGVCCVLRLDLPDLLPNNLSGKDVLFIQVDVGSDFTLKAMVDGKVIISCEQLNPLPDSPLYEKVQDGLVIHKKFLNIYPAPLHGKFRMIDFV